MLTLNSLFKFYSEPSPPPNSKSYYHFNGPYGVLCSLVITS